jgi:nicotinamidase-related amidase
VSAALIVVDVQRAFGDPSWGTRNNPDCEDNIAALIAHWRRTGRPLVFVRHDSLEPGSTLAPDAPGNAFQDVITGEPDLLVTKSVNSSFHGEPSLQDWLDGEGIGTIYVCGITTNHCCETTARVGGNLGYDVRFVLDATHTFDRPDPFGGIVTADELARVTAANLHEEFATVIDTRAALAGEAADTAAAAPFRTSARGDLQSPPRHG